jgi:hypothetical protein
MEIPKFGDKGKAVRDLQSRLLDLGYKLPKFGADGDFGEETALAVKAWQLDYHVDGTLDEREMQALFPPEAERKFPNIPNSQKEVIEIYGKPWNDVDGWWEKWGAPVELPDELKRLTKRGLIWTNKDLVPVLEAVFEEIVDQGLARHLKTYNGCHSVRKIRGSKTRWSTHSWALALDFNMADNMLGTEGKMNPGIVTIFEKHGFRWGGSFRRKDPMHFQRVTGF